MTPDAPAPESDDLRFQKSLLEAQSEASPDGILVVSPEGRLLSFNRRFVHLWGSRRTSSPRARTSGPWRPCWISWSIRRPSWIASPTSTPTPRETASDTLHLKDGRTFERYSAPVSGPDETVYGRIWFFRDVTDRLAREARGPDPRAGASGERSSSAGPACAPCTRRP